MANQPLRALIIEDEEDDVALLLRELRKCGYEVDEAHVDTAEALERALQTSSAWQIILSDYTMPSFDGMAALQMVRRYDKDVPFIFVSGTIGEELAVRAVRSGAQDYILKDNLTRLSAAVPRELREAEIHRKQHEAEQHIQYLANYDELTNLPNRNLYQYRLHQLVTQADQDGQRVGLVLIRLDRFHELSSSLGIQSGDKLLRAFAKRLEDTVAHRGFVARLDSDQFAVILTGQTRRDELIAGCISLYHRFSEPVEVSGYALRINPSVGISLFPDDADKPEGLHGNAALAMQKVIRRGGSSHLFYSPELRRLRDERLNLERELSTVTENNGFTLHYQPQIELSSRRIVAAEALIRWHHPEHGSIRPDQFIPIAEETGHILTIGEWVLEQACREANSWPVRHGEQNIRVAVNFSAFQFRQPDMAKSVEALLERLQLPPHRLEIEITETALMQDPDTALPILKRLRDKGVSISLDDFGTGYSSLSHLKRFPVNMLKIDQSFICDIPDDRDSVEITRAIIAMTARLNIDVIAEGVETKQQAEFLGNEGCGLVQGYLFSRPLPANELTKLLASPNPFKQI
ncbi:EAL domain-containing protein [Marinobacterium sp. D7]|uniref:putative bifunctional diguanylate cyclase/phosphodiesterase n=1 Tax=Marinobacterium ramblicola TaxID=2849041 RepID=UPI001C2D9BD9|nr:GGDEF and EAL domain-containing protein [Marinobacterium ramblicola]MBV1786666.1 EAL domain-containing protein [Marinobacterium ramblicola]